MIAVFTIHRGLAAILSLGGIAALVFLAHVLVVTAAPASAVHDVPGAAGTPAASDNVVRRRRGIKALIIGFDGRASTSKVQLVLWTFAVFYAFLFLLLWGRSWGCSGDDLSAEQVISCNQAADERSHWAEITGRELQADYYVLLGFPLAVAVAAKALTSTKVATGTVAKPPNEDERGVVAGLSEVISNDHGETDLQDFQYFAFNLIALAFFWTEFLTDPGRGLPDLPATLIGLAGLSAAAYTTRKALQEDVKPGVSAVIPRRIPAAVDVNLSVIGSGFDNRTVLPAPQGDPPSSVSPAAWVKLDGIALDILQWSDVRIEAKIPAGFLSLHPLASDQAQATEIVVDVQDGRPSDAFNIELIPQPGGEPGGPK